MIIRNKPVSTRDPNEVGPTELKSDIKTDDDFNTRFQGYMKKVISDLNPDHDWVKDPIFFEFKPKQIHNGYHLKVGNDAVIGVYAGTFNINESALYCLAAHEYGHFLKSQDPNRKSNSKAEETFSDVHLLERVEELGFDARQSKFVSDGTRSDFDEEAIQAVEDVHPLTTIRNGIIDMALTGIRTKRGALNHDKNTINADSKDFSYIKQHHELIVHPETVVKHRLMETPVENLAFASKEDLNLELERISNKVESLLAQSDDLSALNLSEITETLEDFNKRLTSTLDSNNRDDYYVEGEYSPFTPEISRFCALTSKVFIHCCDTYPAGEDREIARSFSKFITVVEKIKSDDVYSDYDWGNCDPGNLGNHLWQFKVAANKETASVAARNILAGLEKYHNVLALHLDGIRRLFSYTDHAFKLPKLNFLNRDAAYQPPWQKHLAWLDDSAIKLVLLRSGVVDEELYRNCSFEELQSIQGSLLTNSAKTLTKKRSQIMGTFDVQSNEVKAVGFEIIEGHKRVTLGVQMTIAGGDHFDQESIAIHDLVDAFIGRQYYDRVIQDIDDLYQDALKTKPLSKERDDLISKIFEKQCIAEKTLNIFPDTELKLSLIGLDDLDTDMHLFFDLHPEYLIDNLQNDFFNKLQAMLDDGQVEDVSKVVIGLSHFKSQALLKPTIDFLLANSKKLEDKQLFSLLNVLDGYRINMVKPEMYDLTNTINLENLDRAFGLKFVDSYDDLTDRIKQISSYSANTRRPFKNIWITAAIEDCFSLLDGDEIKPSTLVELVENIPEYILHSHGRIREYIVDFLEGFDFQSIELDEQVKLFQKISTAKLVPTVQAEQALIRGILNAIENVADNTEQREHIELMMQSTAMQWPQYARQLNQLWIDNVKVCSSSDSDLYDFANNISSKIAMKDTQALMVDFADSVSSQKQLSENLGALTKELSWKQAMGADQTAVGAFEAFIELSTRDAMFRDALQNYLLDDSSSNSEKLEKSFIDASRAKTRSELTSTGVAHAAHKVGKLSANVRRRMFQVYRTNFWNVSLVMRAGLIKLMTLPSQEDDKLRDAFWGGNAEYINRKLFSGQDTESKAAKEILNAFCSQNVMAPEDAEMFISTVFSAANEHKHTAVSSVGRRLSTLLSNMGPAFIKLGQAIHSYEDTPPNLREGMDVMKLDVDAPARWSLFEQMDSVLPDELISRITHVEERLGSASYYYVYKVRLDDGKDYALALLKPGAKVQSELGFEKMEKLVDEIKRIRASFDVPVPVYLSSLEELIQQSHSMAKIETDHEKSIEQNARAKEIYNGRSVTVNGQEFKFGIAKNTDFVGPGYRLMELAEGTSFNDISSDQDPEWHKDFSMAYHYLELTSILSGDIFDEDRHGGQMKVQANNAMLFDFGAMKLVKPEDDELKVLGKLLYQFYKKMSSDSIADLGSDLSTAFIDEINARKVNGLKDTGYLTSVYKAWLALGDFRKNFSSDDYKTMFISLFQSGKISSVVLDSFKDGMNLIEKSAFATVLKASKQVIKIK
jgi:predicted unusual protein kinase regulating ubiquinone biosynthesis (AarF/ABC1/UbiB family)